MSSSKHKILFSNTVIFAVGNISVKLISFFLMPLYTSQLTIEQYGVAELINNSIEIFLPIATLCVIDALFRFTIDEDADYKKIMSTSINMLSKSFILVFVLCTVFFFFSRHEFTYYFYFLYIATTLHRLFAQFARGLGHMKRFAVSGVINALTLVIMNTILLLVLNGGAESYLISLIVSHIVAGIFSFFASKEYLYVDLKKVDKVLLKSMLVFSIPNVPNMVSWWINNISSRYIVLGFCGAGMAGMFTAASKLPAMINLFTNIFRQAWQYSTAKEIKSKDRNKFFSDVFKYYSGFIFLTCSAIIMLIPYLSVIILRGDFYDAWVYVPLLLISATLSSFSAYFGAFYTAIKNNFMAMVSTGAGAIVSIMLNFMLVPFIGVYGALVSSVIGYSIIIIIRIIDTRKYVSIKIDYPFFILKFVIVLIQAIVLTTGIELAKAFSFVCLIVMILLHLSLIKDIFKFFYNFIRRKIV